ncbi:MAG: helix-turn-helix transcriptional regulator [Lentisphaeria bacterium]|nr:helix-turn-helix transcriptional regulator [Lentisphaeria bacterium]
MAEQQFFDKHYEETILDDVSAIEGKSLVINYLKDTCINSNAEMIFRKNCVNDGVLLHSHKYYEIIFFGDSLVDPFVTPEKILITPPGVIHEPIIKDGCVVLFQVSFDIFTCCFYKRGFTTSFEMQHNIKGQLLLDMLNLFHQYSLNDSKDCLHARRNAFLIALAEVLEALPPYMQTQPYYANMALWFIETHFQLPHLTVSDVAKHVSLSSHQLNNILKKEYNMTINQTIAERRMIEAKKLLETTDMTISEISNMCGYRERNYFTNNFIKRYKISPVQYRNKNRRK